MILTARKDEHCFRTPVKLLQRLCRVQRVIAGTPRLGSLPAVTSQPEYAPIEKRDTTDSDAGKPSTRGRVMPVTHTARAESKKRQSGKRIFPREETER